MVESSERALNGSKKLVYLLHLVVFKLTKFVSNVPNLADPNDGLPQSTKTKTIVSLKEESLHVLIVKCDHIAKNLVASQATSSTVTTSVTQHLVPDLVSMYLIPSV